MGFFDRAKQKVNTLDTAQNQEQFIVLDVETTGLNPNSDRIVEIALIEFTQGTVSKQFVSRFNPEGPMGATKIHGITDADVENSPKFVERSSEILEFIKSRPLVAHNAGFDLAYFALGGRRGNLKFQPYQLHQ